MYGEYCQQIAFILRDPEKWLASFQGGFFISGGSGIGCACAILRYQRAITEQPNIVHIIGVPDLIKEYAALLDYAGQHHRGGRSQGHLIHALGKILRLEDGAVAPCRVGKEDHYRPNENQNY